MEKIASLLQGLASLAWPIIFAIILYWFRDIIRTVLESAKSRKFTVKVAGNELTMEEASEQQRNLISDLQQQVILIQEKLGITPNELATATERAERKSERVKSILWVDDIPKNNAYSVAQLRERGIKVITSLSTSDALQIFEPGKFDRIITDMGRNESGRFNPTAGIDLIRQIRAIDKEVPIIVSCSSDAVEKYGAVAHKAGANAISSSASVVLSALNLGELSAAI